MAITERRFENRTPCGERGAVVGEGHEAGGIRRPLVDLVGPPLRHGAALQPDPPLGVPVTTPRLRRLIPGFAPEVGQDVGSA